jgi:EAL and modified HD-GYP domain-containing signal transduction protein
MMQSLSPQNTVLMLNQSDLLEADNLSLIMSMNTQGFGLMLCDVDHELLASNDGLLCLMTHVEMAFDHPDLAEVVRFAKLAEPPLSVVVKNLSDWGEFDACAARGLSGFFGNLCIAPHKALASVELNPQTALIVQLMQMLHQNADIRDLETVLKRDATISYKLFRYINSASFGIEIEIQSLRHAVTMLGYRPLYRWLSLLLVMSNTEGFSPALLQAAIVRGRFIELLGRKLFSKNDAENLFVVGLFSLLDKLLGVPMEEVVRQISLPEVIAQALLSNEGVYGPFLALALACEDENGRASDFADPLFMTAAQVNEAHLSALAWNKNFEM